MEEEEQSHGLRLNKERFVTRLEMEWKMRALLPQASCFLLILVLFILNLHFESDVSETKEINDNFKYHFDLEACREIQNFGGIYEFLGTFFDAAERFDPLDRDRYVKRRYLYGDQEVAEFNKSITGVLLTRKKRFFVTNAVIIRPQLWMRRASRKNCEYFAKSYDSLYSMSRYLRYKFRGKILSGAWQPEIIKFGDKVMATRTGGNPPPMQNEIEAGDVPEYNSDLLMCLDRREPNTTLRKKLKDVFNNVDIKMEGRTWFGDFYPEKTDLMAYMGYRVYANQIDKTTHPRCFTANLRDAEGEIQKRKNQYGEFVLNGSKINIHDVDERCDHDASTTWHDVQTRAIRSFLVLYTPGAEVFTKIEVEWIMRSTGSIQGNFKLDSFQNLKKSPRYDRWMALTVIQIIIGLIQFAFIVRRVHLEKFWEKKCPQGNSFDAGEKVAAFFAVVLQVGYMVFFLVQIFKVELEDVDEQIASYLQKNPYASDQAREEVANLQAQIFEKAESQKSISVFAFVLVIASFFQILAYMNIHPQLGVVASTSMSVAGDLFGFFVSLGLVIMICASIGFYAFGDTLDWQSPFGISLVNTISYGLGGFAGDDFMSSAGEYDDLRQMLMLCVWELTTLFVIFLLLLSFLLAIVVDGYAPNKAFYSEGPFYSFLRDFYVFFRLQIKKDTVKRRGGRWAARPQILQQLRDLPDDVEYVGASDISTAFHESREEGIKHASLYLETYYKFVPNINVDAPEWEGAQYLKSLTKDLEEQMKEQRATLSPEPTRDPEQQVNSKDEFTSMLKAQGDMVQSLTKALEEVCAQQKVMQNQIEVLQSQQSPQHALPAHPTQGGSGVEVALKGQSEVSPIAVDIVNEHLRTLRKEWEQTLERERRLTLEAFIDKGLQGGWISGSVARQDLANGERMAPLGGDVLGGVQKAVTALQGEQKGQTRMIDAVVTRCTDLEEWVLHRFASLELENRRVTAEAFKNDPKNQVPFVGASDVQKHSPRMDMLNARIEGLRPDQTGDARVDQIPQLSQRVTKVEHELRELEGVVWQVREDMGSFHWGREHT